MKAQAEVVFGMAGLETGSEKVEDQIGKAVAYCEHPGGSEEVF